MKRRILFVQPPYIAGAMISLKEQIEEFQRKGYVIELIISGKYDIKIEEMYQNIGITPRFIKMYPWVVECSKNTVFKKIKFIIKYFYNIFFAKYKIKCIVKTFAPDYIYCNSYDNYLPIVVAKEMKIPSIMHFREYGILDHASWYYFPSYARKILQNISLRICISKSVKEFYESKFPGLSFELVYNGISNKLVDTQASAPAYIRDVGIIGRICEGKGQLFVVENAECFPDIRFHLWGSGSGEYLELIEETIKEKELKNVIIEGYTSDIGSIYKTLDMIIAPSKCEAFGRIIIEAMFNKKLVMASSTGSFPELVKDGETGFIFDLNNDSFYKVMNRALVSDIPYIVDKAYKMASGYFTSKRANDQIVDLINQLG